MLTMNVWRPTPSTLHVGTAPHAQPIRGAQHLTLPRSDILQTSVVTLARFYMLRLGNTQHPQVIADLSCAIKARWKARNDVPDYLLRG